MKLFTTRASYDNRCDLGGALKLSLGNTTAHIINEKIEPDFTAPRGTTISSYTRTRGVQRYVLRARVPAQPDYPYATGSSRLLRVRVRG